VSQKLKDLNDHTQTITEKVQIGTFNPLTPTVAIWVQLISYKASCARSG